MKEKKPQGHRLMALLLAAVMLVSLLPVAVFAADGGSFALLAVTEEGLLIEPAYVSYAQGATVGEALLGSGYTFTGIDTGTVTAVNGTSGSFTLCGAALEDPAAGVTALWLTTNSSQVYGSNLAGLLQKMAQYKADGSGVQSDADAQAAYAAAASGFYGADDAAAATLSAGLGNAMDAYAAAQAGAGKATEGSTPTETTAATEEPVPTQDDNSGGDAGIPNANSDTGSTAAGKAAFLAVNAEGLLIEPCYISYSGSDTVADMLKNSGHTFEGIDSGFISAVDGVTDNYTLHYNNDGYKLDDPASGVTALWFTTNASQAYEDDLLALVEKITEYAASANGVKNYAAAQKAYEAAVAGLYQADGTAAAKLLGDLKSAMDNYDAFLAGGKVTLNLALTQDGTSVPAGTVTLTGEYGNVITAENVTSVEAEPGVYSYEISDGTYRWIRGTVEIRKDETNTLTAELPSGTCITSVDLGIENNWSTNGQMAKDNVTESSATYYLPDYADGKLYPCVVPASGVDTSTCKIYYAGYSSSRVWNSKATVVTSTYTGMAANSLEGTTGVLEARVNKGGYVQYQTYTVNIVRYPTLADLRISGDGTLLKLDFVNRTFEYAVTTTSETVDVTLTALCDGAGLTVAGQAAVSGGTVNVPLAGCVTDDNGAYLVPVVLTAENGQTTTYTIKVTKVAAVGVTVTHDTDVSVDIINAAGVVVSPKTAQDGKEVYSLIPGETYTYLSTRNTYYHATAAFTASDGLTVAAATPKTENWLTALAASGTSSATGAISPVQGAFDASVHEYTFQVDSVTTNLYLQAVPAGTSAYTVEAIYNGHINTNYAANTYTKTPGSTTSKYVTMTQFLAAGGYGNDMQVKVTQKTVENGVTFYQDYLVTVDRKLALYKLSAADSNGIALPLTRKSDGTTTGYLKTELGYTTMLGQMAQEMDVTFQVLSAYKNDADFTVAVSCDDWTKEIVYSADLTPNTAQTVTVPMDPAKAAQTIAITVKHTDTGAVAQTYTIEVNKLPPVATTITTDPAGATVFLTSDVTGARILPEVDGTYTLDTDTSYTCNVTRYGYNGQSIQFVAGEANKTVTVTLEKSPDSTLTDIKTEGDWTEFRADSDNNGTVTSQTPTTAEDAVLVWANRIGEGFDSGATGCPIIVGGYLYTYAGNAIVKVNKDTGEVVASGEMIGSSSFAINSPTYAQGMIFVGLSSGRVQAFNAETLTSLWVYQDALGGQPNCPIAYQDGYVYTGFWNSETKSANFVCLSVTDEDPSQTTEAKMATWSYTDNGFYWAGAYTADNYVLVPTDDGENGYTTGYGAVLSLDPLTGRLIDAVTATNVGDIRSSICYDSVTDAYYFTSKGGDFYQVKVNADGTFVENSLRRLHLENGLDNYVPMSTSTPTICNGRAYIGVSGSGQFNAYSGHNITVIDLASFSIAYTVPTQGYPQTSGLATSYYEGEDGYTYIYFIDNFTPGKLRVIRDKPGMTEVDHTYTTMETYTSGGKEVTVETAYVLFTPSGTQAQYAICSPIVDSDGNLYFKNDSAQMMRLGFTMTRLEVTKDPDKLTYEVGQTFDAAGMKVTAYYSNGTSKDVTENVTFTTEALRAEDTEITISYDLDSLLEKEDTAAGGYWQMYQNNSGKVGVTYELPTATVTLTINDDHSWDEGTVENEPTCTEAGKRVYHCEICEETRDEPISPAGHDMELTPAVAPTYTADGNVAYYTCGTCGNLYLDEDGKNQTTGADVILPKMVELSGNTAEVRQSAIDAAIADSQEAGEQDIVLDLSGVSGGITNVVLPNSALTAAGDGGSLTLCMSDAEVMLDAAALAAIPVSGEGTFRIIVRQVAASALNNAQQAAVEGKNVAVVITAFVLADGNEVTDFDTGTVGVACRFALEQGTTASDYALYYVSVDASALVDTEFTYESGYVVFYTNHFSEWVLVNTKTAGEVPEAPTTGEATAPAQGTTVPTEGTTAPTAEATVPTSEQANSAQTGDSSNLRLWTILLIMSVTFCAVLLQKKRAAC